MSCAPSYAYVPTFTPSNTDCVIPTYTEHRSRVSIPGDEIITTSLFFRSVDQTYEANQIEVELTAGGEFRVFFNGTQVAGSPYMVTFGTGAIATLRSALSSSTVIEMPPVATDVYDLRVAESDGDGIVTPGLAPFARTFLTGGQGAPTDGSTISSIRTGPSRTLYLVKSQEDVFGNDVVPGPSQKIRQWNGTTWISYCNNVPGQCPGEGTC